jgi:outer membrane protein OmpA-like peptidoglycan-associated protein
MIRQKFFFAAIAVAALSVLNSNDVHAQGTVVLRDDFNDNHNNWPVGDYRDGESSIDDGVYHLKKETEAGDYYFTIPITINPGSDFTIEARMRQNSGTDQNGYGICWGTQDSLNSYSYVISPGSTKFYEYFNDGKYYSTRNWEDTKSIKPNGEWNTILLRKQASAISFYVNGEPMSAFNFSVNPLKGNLYGFTLNLNMDVDVDYIEIRNIPAKPIALLSGTESFSSKPENLGDAVNSAASEILDFVSPDGKTIYFNRDDHPDNIPPTENADIWIAHLLSNGSWGNLEHPGRPLNNQSKNIVISVTPDDNLLFLQNRFLENGDPNGSGFSVSYRTGEGWTVPKDVDVVNNYNRSKSTESCLSPDGRVLLSSMIRDDSKGGKDIYVSYRIDDEHFGEWKNCGDLNSAGDDIGPFIAADGQTLYFSSTGYPGYGSQDIFVSRRLDDTWQHWSEPKNMGPAINDTDFNAYYMVSGHGDWAYYTSSSSTGYGKEDLFRIRLPEAAKPKPVLIVSGRVLDSKTNQPLAAAVHYEILAKGVEAGVARSSPADGQYRISLPSGNDYGFRASVKGYYPVSEQLNTSDLKEYTEIHRDLYLTPVEVNQAIRLNNVFFDFSKYDLRPESYPELDRLVQFLTENPGSEIELRGHTDNVGSDADNLKLSQNRVNSVRSYLTGKGIVATRLAAKGLGKSQPIADNTSDDGRQKNRRVEFVILKQ